MTTVLPSNDYELGTQELNITQRNSTEKENEGGSDFLQQEVPPEGYEANAEYSQIEEEDIQKDSMKSFKRNVENSSVMSNEVNKDLFDIDDFPPELVQNVTLLEDLVNVPRHRGILHGFSESISVIP